MGALQRSKGAAAGNLLGSSAGRSEVPSRLLAPEASNSRDSSDQAPCVLLYEDISSASS